MNLDPDDSRMNRISAQFNRLRKAGRKGLVGFLTAGDPDLAQSERDIRAAIESGLDLLELGVPFSDPTADGPTIQAASARALAAGTDLKGILGLVRRLRRDYALPLVLFSYANPLFRYGYEKICADAAEAGVDGALVVDLPDEEADELRPYLAAHGLCRIPLVAPPTPEARMAKILADAEGFVYYISVKGVTGQRAALPPDIREHIALLRKHTCLPVAIGFGIGNGAQAREAAACAEAVVVGSALVKAARDGRLPELVRELAVALRG